MAWGGSLLEYDVARVLDANAGIRSGGGARQYILGQTLRSVLERRYAGALEEALEPGATRWTRAARLSPHTRKMLQLMMKTFDCATRKVVCATTLSLLVSVASAGLAAGQTQTPAQAPADSQSSSQTQAPTAAPGTVALSKATAAALAPYTGPKYNNRWELYAGLNFMNGQAGQVQPGRRYNMGGGEVMGTYWLGGAPVKRWGLVGDFRFGAGTTPVTSPFYNRVLIMQSIPSGGVELRGPKNRYAAIDFHALAGETYGHFNYAVNHYPGGSPVSACAAQQGIDGYGNKGNLGLYCNHWAPWGAVGGSIDFNESGKLAIRLSPDMTFEHFGTETRIFFAISMGAVYRFGTK